MLYVSSSYVASTLRTTLINASFQQHGQPHRAVAPKLRAHEPQADSIEVQPDKKKTRKRAPFQAKGISLKSPSKTTQKDGLGLQFHACFLFFPKSDVSDDERISRCPRTSFAAHLGLKQGEEGVAHGSNGEGCCDHPTTTKGEEAEEEGSVRRTTTTNRTFPDLSWGCFCTKMTEFFCRRLKKGCRRLSRRFLRQK